MNKKKIKIISIISAVVAVIIAASALISANYTRIHIDVMYSLMPDYIDGSFDDVNPVRIYKRKNPNFDYKTQKDNPLQAYEFYFYDDEGNEISTTGDEELVLDGEEIGMMYGDFLPQMLENWESLKTKLIVCAVIASLLIISGLIVLWFIVWSKKQDEEKAKKYSNKNNQKSKKRKKSKRKN